MRDEADPMILIGLLSGNNRLVHFALADEITRSWCFNHQINPSVNNFFSQDGLNIFSLLWSLRTCSLSSYNDLMVGQY